MAGPLDRAYVEITAELDTRQAQRAANAAGRAVENELTSGVSRAEQAMARQAAKVGETVGKTIADTTGEALGEGLRRNASGRIVDAQGRFVSAARASGEVIGDALAEGVGDGLENGFKRDVNGRLRDQFGRFVNDGGRGGRDTGTAFGDGFGEGLSATLSSIAGIRLPVSGFALFGGALAAAAASAIQLTAALAPAVGIVAGLPSVIGVAAAGMTTLNVATLGVGDAFASAFGDAEEFEEAMEGLAPSVQEAAQALRDMAPALDELRDRVQDAFFEDFDRVLVSLAETLLGPVSDGMTAVASAMNGVIQNLAVVATSQEGIDFVTQSFAIMAGVIDRLQEPLSLLFSSLLSIGTAINEAFGEDTGAGLANLITQFAAFLSQAAASGEAVNWIRDAMAVFSAIGDILSPIVGIFASIGAAASATGGNILGVFGQVLQTFDDFLASAQGQTVLITIFEALNTVGQSFATVLGNIAPAIPPIISGISNILGAVAPLLGPLSQLVGSVLTALAPILNVVAAAIQPLIAPLTEILELLGPLLVDAINTLMPVISLLAEVLGANLSVVVGVVGAVFEALAPIITAVLDALEPLIEALEPLFQLLGVVADLIGTVLEPIITALGAVLLWLVENVIVPYVIPIIEVLIDLLVLALGTAIEWVVQQFQQAGENLSMIFEFIKEKGEEHTQALIGAWNLLQAAFRTAWNHINNNVFTPLKNGIAIVKSTVLGHLNTLKTGWNTFVGFILNIPNRISGALSNMFSPLASGFRSAINSVIAGWNNLSFSIPSVEIPGVGTVGGGTINTPNIPYLARGGLVTGPTLAMVGEAGTEAVLPLEDSRVTDVLASALSRAGVTDRSGNESSSGTINAVGQSGDNFFLVKIGERELTDIVVEQHNAMTRETMRRARAATGRSR
jgi:phage-related protein